MNECVSTEISGFPCRSLRGKHGVGRIDIVENRFIGMKSRGKKSKILFIFICLGYDVLLFMQISRTGFLTHTKRDVRCK